MPPTGWLFLSFTWTKSGAGSGHPIKPNCPSPETLMIEAGVAVMVNLAVAAPMTPGAVAVSVYPVPGRSMVRLAKVATAFTALRVVVPPSVPPPGLVPITIVTGFVAFGTEAVHGPERSVRHAGGAPDEDTTVLNASDFLFQLRVA